MEKWIDRKDVLARLGVKPQTLYAYVSRGQIGMQADPQDTRRSLYSVDDVEALLARRKRGRRPAAIAQSAVSWGEPVLDTAITAIQRGRLIYRGQDAVSFAKKASLEEAAQLLWQAALLPNFSCEAGAGKTPFEALAQLAASAKPALGRKAERVQVDAAQAIAHLARALGAQGGEGPVHHRLAQAWGLNPEAEQAVRRALVLVADHEFNPSTFAVRVAASTGAPIAAALLAGLCALSGPKHGGASAALLALIRDAEQDGVEKAVSDWLGRTPQLPGFGHRLYPAGDPRAEAMTERLSYDALLAALNHHVFEITGQLPNLDFGLVALIRAYKLPLDAGFILFALGRSIGWAAHAMEQGATSTTIRPRARYIGPLAHQD